MHPAGEGLRSRGRTNLEDTQSIKASSVETSSDLWATALPCPLFEQSCWKPGLTVRMSNVAASKTNELSACRQGRFSPYRSSRAPCEALHARPQRKRWSSLSLHVFIAFPSHEIGVGVLLHQWHNAVDILKLAHTDQMVPWQGVRATSIRL